MPKVKISEYSATANSNTDVASINIDEGCAPSGINNAIRAVMGHLKDFQQGTYGDPFNGPVNGTLGATTASTANVTTLTTSSTVTHNGGTANGVAYLNGSKVLTTGSALVFDGTNLGVGVTPSAWNSNFKALQISTGGSLSAAVSQSSLVDLGGNFYQDSGGTERYIASSTANKYRQYAGAHSWYTAASGTAGNAITFTQAMTLDASGNLGIGTTSPATRLDVSQANAKSATGVWQTQIFDSTSQTTGVGGGISFSGYKTAQSSAEIFAAIDAYKENSTAGNAAGALRFHTQVSGGSGLVERARFDSSGNLLVGDTSVIGSGKLSIKSDNSISTKGVAGTSGGNWIMYRADTAARIWEITSNANNFFIADDDFSHYASLDPNPTAWVFGSDRRIKTDIADIEYGLDAVMAMKPRKYKMISSGKTNIGFIAQELQTVIPEAVAGEEIEYLDTDTPQEKASKTMGVSKDTLIPVLVKAIQEQQALITQLTARITALEGA